MKMVAIVMPKTSVIIIGLCLCPASRSPLHQEWHVAFKAQSTVALKPIWISNKRSLLALPTCSFDKAPLHCLFHLLLPDCRPRAV